MSLRELTALGTSSQVPTRQRNHNGYFLRWDDEGLLFDPGEGTQRQMTVGALPSSAIHRVCITHFHGDHCLGMAGIVQRLSLDRCEHPVAFHYPASGQTYFERLRYASIYTPGFSCEPVPVDDRADGLVEVARTGHYTLYAHALEHGEVPCVGYRLEEHGGRRFLPDRLAELGVQGRRIQDLARDGSVRVGDRVVTLDEVSVEKHGSVVAFVMDTRPCVGASALARDADLLVMEATYASSEQALARDYFHSSSVDAATTARDAGAHALAITHFSQRYASVDAHLAEARAIFPHTIALRDFDRVEIPRRR